MTEKEKMLAGLMYDAAFDPALAGERIAAKELCYDYNNLRPREAGARREILDKLFGHIAGEIIVEQPFHCDYGV